MATMIVGVGPLDHTDDGCPIETHCTACRTGLAGGLATLIPVPLLGLVWSFDIAEPAPALSVTSSDTPRTLALRGPPANQG